MMTDRDPPPGSPRYGLNRVVFDLTRDANARSLVAEKSAFFSQYRLSAEERQALLEPDWRRLLALGLLPNLLYRYYALHGHTPESFPQALAPPPGGA
jgi:hypothetical protein